MPSTNSKNSILMLNNKPLPRQNDGTKRRIHSKTIAAVLRLLLSKVGSAARSLRIKTTIAPAMEMKKLKQTVNRLHIDGDLKKKDKM
mmetsp:Transcript_15627/g.32870  ORF Transcript_15627/g.32870 Transcript_15627/m.32870 type:complete len:87 (-) Transcript_15627:4176-4436(-)